MFKDFDIDDAQDAFDSSKETINKYIADTVNYIDSGKSISDDFFNSTRSIVKEYGDPFGIVDGFVGGYIDDAQAFIDDSAGIIKQALGIEQYQSTPYQNISKQYLKKMIDTPFKQGWQWVLEADDTPPDFDIYVRDIDLGLGSIDVDVTNIGSGSISKPTSSQAGEITMTVRDHIDGRIERWFAAQLGKVKNHDGTVNLPKDYVFEIRLKSVDFNGKKHPWKKYRVWAVSNSTTLNYSAVGEYISYTITLQKFSTLGKKAF